LKLDLGINGLRFELGVPQDKPALLSAGFTRPNWLSKAMMLAAPWAPVFFARGPAMSCFLSPHETPKDTDFFGMAEDNRLFVYLWFWGGSLQIFEANLVMAVDPQEERRVFAHWFAQVAGAHLGSPTIEDARMRAWQEADQQLVAGKKRFYLRWAAGPWRVRLGTAPQSRAPATH